MGDSDENKIYDIKSRITIKEGNKMAMDTIGQWLNTTYQDYLGGQTRKETMFGKGVGALESYADIFRPGGAYGEGVEAMIGRGKKRAVAGGMQSLVSAGLAGTTMPMHLEQTFEEEIGMPTRLRAEDLQMERLGGALGSLGQMYANYDPGTATMGQIGQMATTQANIKAQEDAASLQQAYSQFARTSSKPYVSTAEKMDMWKAGGGGTFESSNVGGGATQHFNSGSFSNPYRWE